VIPVADEQWGQVGEGSRRGDESPTVDELASFLDGRLARFKHPRHLAFVDEMPTNGPDKVDRVAVTREFGGGDGRTVRCRTRSLIALSSIHRC